MYCSRRHIINIYGTIKKVQSYVKGTFKKKWYIKININGNTDCYINSNSRKSKVSLSHCCQINLKKNSRFI